MKKRGLLLLTACMMTIGMLAGCSSDNEQAESAQRRIRLQMRQVRIQKRIQITHQAAQRQTEKRWWYTIPQQEIRKQWQIILQILQAETYLSWSRRAVYR